jgi:hypothetical protein
VENEIYATHTHVARVRVMKTVTGSYRGIVHLRRVGAEPESDDPHQTEQDSRVRIRNEMPRALLPASCSKSVSSELPRRPSEPRQSAKGRKRRRRQPCGLAETAMRGLPSMRSSPKSTRKDFFHLSRLRLPEQAGGHRPRRGGTPAACPARRRVAHSCGGGHEVRLQGVPYRRVAS